MAVEANHTYSNHGCCIISGTYSITTKYYYYYLLLNYYLIKNQLRLVMLILVPYSRYLL
jgi:hypothetical protein